MERYYIADISGNGGISHYAGQFYQHILAPLNYTLMDSRTDPADILSRISSKDIVHIETGIFSNNEQEILVRMLESGYTKIRATMHDPPLFRYPSTRTSIPWAEYLIKVRDRFFGGQRKFSQTLEKLQCIYVLSSKGQDAIQKTLGINNTRVIPHIVAKPTPPGKTAIHPDFIYLGFIGRNKGLEYALAVHKLFIKKHPESRFLIAGTTLDKNASYMESLREHSNANVRFLGYVPEPELNERCSQAAFAFQPFRAYRGYTPVSGSILYCMQRGTLVLTNPVNAIPELIRDHHNGIFLTGNAEKDALLIHNTWNDKAGYEKIRQNAYQYLRENHAPDTIAKQLID